ncbi:MAG: hypothetical protein IPP74_09320 [Alphaproteobacteria bacterium]|nr:hypothetical protein [Alphaproteobacteria bacterium]
MSKAHKKVIKNTAQSQAQLQQQSMEKIFPEMVMSLPELYRSIMALTQLLEQETKALIAMKISEVRALQAKKEALADILFRFNDVLRSKPNVIDEYPRPERLALRQLIARFREELHKNHRELTKHHLVQQRVMRLVGKAMIQSDPLTSTYSRTGKKSDADKGSWFSQLALSLDENI